jgi:hypothetical protein
MADTQVPQGDVLPREEVLLVKGGVQEAGTKRKANTGGGGDTKKKKQVSPTQPEPKPSDFWEHFLSGDCSFTLATADATLVGGETHCFSIKLNDNATNFIVRESTRTKDGKTNMVYVGFIDAKKGQLRMVQNSKGVAPLQILWCCMVKNNGAIPEKWTTEIQGIGTFTGGSDHNNTPSNMADTAGNKRRIEETFPDYSGEPLASTNPGGNTYSINIDTSGKEAVVNIGGNTFAVKNRLKALGFQFSGGFWGKQLSQIPITPSISADVQIRNMIDSLHATETDDVMMWPGPGGKGICCWGAFGKNQILRDNGFTWDEASRTHISTEDPSQIKKRINIIDKEGQPRIDDVQGSWNLVNFTQADYQDQKPKGIRFDGNTKTWGFSKIELQIVFGAISGRDVLEKVCYEHVEVPPQFRDSKYPAFGIYQAGKGEHFAESGMVYAVRSRKEHTPVLKAMGFSWDSNTRAWKADIGTLMDKLQVMGPDEITEAKLRHQMDNTTVPDSAAGDSTTTAWNPRGGGGSGFNQTPSVSIEGNKCKVFGAIQIKDKLKVLKFRYSGSGDKSWELPTADLMPIVSVDHPSEITLAKILQAADNLQ